MQKQSKMAIIPVSQELERKELKELKTIPSLIIAVQYDLLIIRYCTTNNKEVKEITEFSAYFCDFCVTWQLLTQIKV